MIKEYIKTPEGKQVLKNAIQDMVNRNQVMVAHTHSQINQNPQDQKLQQGKS